VPTGTVTRLVFVITSIDLLVPVLAESQVAVCDDAHQAACRHRVTGTPEMWYFFGDVAHLATVAPGRTVMGLLIIPTRIAMTLSTSSGLPFRRHVPVKQPQSPHARHPHRHTAFRYAVPWPRFISGMDRRICFVSIVDVSNVAGDDIRTGLGDQQKVRQNVRPSRNGDTRHTLLPYLGCVIMRKFSTHGGREAGTGGRRQQPMRVGGIHGMAGVPPVL